MAQGPKALWIEQVLGVRIDAKSSVPQLDEAMKAWQSSRAAVRAQLAALGQAIRAANDPEANDALVLIGGIASNLTERPDTPQKIKEIESYLLGEDLIDDAEAPNGFGVTVSIRDPLLPALARVKAAMAA